MAVTWRWSVTFIFIWLAGASAGITLVLEYPAHVSAVLWRSYPGLFQWPVFFLPLTCIFLVKPMRLTWRFLRARAHDKRLVIAFFVLPIGATLIGMSGYEWFNDKAAVWEAKAATTRLAIAPTLPPRYRTDPDVSRVRSFDDLALSIRAKSSPADLDVDCQFDKRNIRDYRTAECFCPPIHVAATAARCDRVKNIVYQSLYRAIHQPGNHSYTYYTSRLAFSAMSLVFISGFVTVLYMACFSDDLKQFDFRAYEVAKPCIQIFSLLCSLWGLQRIYLNQESSRIFPRDIAPIVLSNELALLLCIIIFVGVTYAYSMNIHIVQSFMDKLFLPFVFLCSIAFSAALPDVMISLCRVSFGVDATGPSILATVTFALFFCMIPVVHLLKDGGWIASGGSQSTTTVGNIGGSP